MTEQQIYQWETREIEEESSEEKTQGLLLFIKWTVQLTQWLLKEEDFKEKQQKKLGKIKTNKLF